MCVHLDVVASLPGTASDAHIYTDRGAVVDAVRIIDQRALAFGDDFRVGGVAGVGGAPRDAQLTHHHRGQRPQQSCIACKLRPR